MTDVEQIKQKIDLVDFINEYVPLKKGGRNFRGNCPFHSEKTPSFYVSPERQAWYCFGCNRGGDLFSFLMEIERLEFIDALRILASKAGIKLRERVMLTNEQKKKDRLYEIHHLASEFFHFILTKHKTGERAREYLTHRGIREETIKTFFLGYAPNSWEATAKYLRKKGYNDQELELSGVLVSGRARPYDRFRGRLMFPIFDHRGQVVAFAGRTLLPHVKEAKYVNSPETPIYTKGNTLFGLSVTKEAIRRENTAILVEGEFDLLSSFQDGATNVVAIKGSALTEGQIQLLKRFTDKIIFALDSDLAGDAASRRGIELADKANFLMKVTLLPQGKDPDECVRVGGGVWKKALKEAIPVYDYFILSAKKRFNITTVEGKKRISDELVPIVARIENPIIRSHYIRLLAQELAVSETTIAEAIEKLPYQQKDAEKPAAQMEKHDRRSRIEQLEDLVLAFLLHEEDHDVVQQIMKVAEPEDFSQPAIRKIFDYSTSQTKKGTKFPLYQHLHALPSELASTLDRLTLTDILPYQRVKRGWQELLREFEIENIQRKIRQITTKIKAYKDDEKDGLATFNAELTRLMTKLKQLEAK